MARKNLERAWDTCLELPEFRMLMSHLGAKCSHGIPTADPEMRVRQQLFLEFLSSGELIDVERPSFGFEYISELANMRDKRKAEPHPAPEHKPSLFDRVFAPRTK
jgi:hypothetical protein